MQRRPPHCRLFCCKTCTLWNDTRDEVNSLQGPFCHALGVLQPFVTTMEPEP